MNERSPVAGRLRRPGWKDPRLLIGILLIAISIVGVTAIVQGADRTVPYYTADSTLTPGTVLEPGDLSVARVRVDAGSYVAVDSETEPWGLVVTRVVEQGELVPASALAGADSFDGRPVAVDASLPVSLDVKPGSVVDVWMTVSDAEGAPSTALVGDGLTVADVVREEGAFSTARTPTVYVIVAQDGLPAFLQALAVDGDVAVVGRAGDI